MLLDRIKKEKLNDFFKKIRLKNEESKLSMDKAVKIEQIIAYLETIDTQIRKYSRKRELVFIEAAAGNCWLSFLIAYYYREIDPRPVNITCMDINTRLMEKSGELAGMLGFDNMHFQACDISDYKHSGNVDIVCSLHACDTATDKALALGIRNNARMIFSVSCCQHSIKKQLWNYPYKSITKHKVFKDRVAYMVSDSMRSLILEMHRYDVDILEFVSSRYTDKNVMIRARIGQGRDNAILKNEYLQLRKDFHVAPALEGYLREEDEDRDLFVCKMDKAG